MKKAYLRELQSSLLGSVTDQPEALDYFKSDASIFQATPLGVVYPQNTADVRKLVQFAAAQSSAGKPISLTARGKGSGAAGGAVGEGIQVVFPAHLNKLLRLDHDSVTVQPGILYRTLQQTLHTHGRWLPPYPASIDYSTIGGAVATNAAGEKSLKYGPTRSFVKKLKVVLSDGTLVEAHRISARELNRKKGLSTLEGEVYRKLDNVILDHEGPIKKLALKTSRNSAGYALEKVRAKDGSFDLSQLFIGAEGTLGLITEVTLKTMPYNPRTTLVVGYFDTSDALSAAVGKIRPLSPSAMEMVDRGLLEFVSSHYAGDLSALMPEASPKAVLLVEFDDTSQLSQKMKAGRAQRILARHAASTRVSTDPVEQVALWKIRRSAADWTWLSDAPKPALPFMDEAIVPVDKLHTLLDKTYKLLAKHDLDAAVWGHAGDGQVKIQPRLDLSKKKDVDKLFSLNREFHELVISLGGSPSGQGGDGLMRAMHLPTLYGEQAMELFASVKHIFDPFGIFSPGHGPGTTEDYVRTCLRSDYTVGHLDHVIYS